MSAVDGYPAGEFVLPRSERVVYGVGCVQRLRAYVDALGGTRVLLLTGRTLARQTELVDRLTALLGRACVGVFAETQAHVPVETVFAAAERARVDRADLLISFGGGSVIDTAKAVAAVLALGITSPEQLDPYFISVEEGSIRVPPIAGSVLPHLAIPTTLSAGEFTGTAGITDPERRRKFLLRDPKLTPRIVLLDPEVTLKTPLGLWTSTGIRALDHAVEAIYGKQHNPITDALALAALEILFACLPASQAQPEALAPRGKAQLAAGMAIWAMSGAGSGLSHGIGYGLGARFGVPHGICSCLTLPHVMRFNRPCTAERQALIAERLALVDRGTPPDAAAEAAAEAVAGLIRRLGHPTRLRDLGIEQADLPELARDTLRLPNAVTNPRPVDFDTLLELLSTAW